MIILRIIFYSLDGKVFTFFNTPYNLSFYIIRNLCLLKVKSGGYI